MAGSKDRSTSGQVGPKSDGGKLRQDSEQTRPSERLRHDDESPPGGHAAEDGGAAPRDGPTDKKAAREAGRMDKSKLRADKTGAKLDTAKEKLAARKPPKKPGSVKTVGKAAGHQAWVYTHSKIHQVEHENVGIEANHKAELAGETVIRGGTRFVKKRIRTRPARQVRKWEKKNINARADLSFRQMAQENPELKKNALSRFWQKQRVKRQYAKQAKETTKATAKAAEKTAVTTEKIAASVWGFIKRNPKVFILLAAAFLLVVILQSCMAALISVGNGVMGAVGGTSYLAADTDIDRAELAYTEWETDLQIEINSAERTHPGYDEYRYNVADISHNPYELMAFITAVYDDFTFSGVEAVLREIFGQQYTLTYTPETEIRYRTETRTDTWTDEDGETHSDTYEVEVAYEYYILNITLTARSFSDVIFNRMNTEQRERFQVYMITKGNRQYLKSPFGETNWLPYVSSYYGYRVHPISGEKNYHKGLDIAMPQGTEILAGQDGTVTAATYDSGFGYYIVLDDGEGLVSKYAHCSTLLVSAGQTVNAGDVIALVGSTGNSTGPHLHLEIIKDGEYLNPLYFTVTNDFGQGPTYGDPGTAMSDGSYAALLEWAELYIGYPYVWGGSSPATSFDCSGYICWIINQSGVGSVGRTTAQGLYNLCTPVSAADAQPGDLIFFTGTYSTTSACSHVGLYVGGGQMIHCGNPINYASINTSYWQSHFYSFGRLP
jgi:murein DD-endopeptidase MepM/ murein hydrolase activator NlpD